MRQRLEEEELTFAPRTTECPAYVKRIARSIALTKAAKANDAGGDGAGEKPDWR